MGLLVTGCLYTWQEYVKTREEKEQQCRAAHKKAQTLHLADLDSNSLPSWLCSRCLKLVTKAPLQPVSCIATAYRVGRSKSFFFLQQILTGTDSTKPWVSNQTQCLSSMGLNSVVRNLTQGSWCHVSYKGIHTVLTGGYAENLTMALLNARLLRGLPGGVKIS